MLRYATVARFWIHLVLTACAVVPVGACSSRSLVPNVSKEAVQAEAERQVAFRFESLIEDSKRLHSVAFRIRTANTRYCGRAVGPSFGLSVLSLENLSKELRATAAARLGIDQLVTVVHVVKDSPARRAGLAPGDRVLEIGGRAVPEGRKGAAVFARTLNQASANSPLRITVLRGTRRLTFALRPVRGCTLPVLLGTHASATAETDGSKIIIHRALLRLVANDDELAMLIGHEMGHIAAGHVKARRRADTSGVLGGFEVDAVIDAEPASESALTRARRLISSKAYPERAEQEADYLGLYFAARAGYDSAAALAFWRKTAEEDPRAVAFAATHPVSPARLALIAKAHDEISYKRRAQAPLEPNVNRR